MCGLLWIQRCDRDGLGVGACIMAGLLLMGCSRGPVSADAPVVDPATLIVEPPMLTLIAGHDAWLAAQANDTSGQPIGGSEFRFTPADSRVLRVTSVGHVIALGPASAHTAVQVASGRKVQNVPVEVRPGPLSQLEIISGDDQRLRAGLAAAAPLLVRAHDQWNNPIPGVALRMIPAAHAFPAADALSGADGTARFTIPAVTEVGDIAGVIQSVSDPNGSASFRMQVQPGPAALIEKIDTDPPSDAVRDPAQVGVRVTDAYGNPLAGVVLQGHLADDAHLVLSAQTDAAGAAYFRLPRERDARAVRLTVVVADAPAIQRLIVVTRTGATEPKSPGSSAGRRTIGEGHDR